MFKAVPQKPIADEKARARPRRLSPGQVDDALRGRRRLESKGGASACGVIWSTVGVGRLDLVSANSAGMTMWTLSTGLGVHF